MAELFCRIVRVFAALVYFINGFSREKEINEVLTLLQEAVG
jgi:hypothetical protein